MLGTIVERYNTLMKDHSDPRVNDWFLMSSPFPTLIMCIVYVLIVKRIGPWLMRDRKPFEMRKTLIVYNLFQVIFSSWIFYEAMDSAWARTYSLGCEPVDYSRSPIAMRIAAACWWYYFSKFTEFFDTFFFVMRKKDHQVSTLHVIHHGIMPISVWIGVKFTPGGHGTFFGLLNTFVHIVMYTYYMLAAIGPQMQKYLWWKKHLTLLQMVQFSMMFVHSARILMMKDCDSPKAFTWLVMLHSAMFFCLFSNFYRQTYKKESRQKAAAAKKKKDDDDRANNRPVKPAQPDEPQDQNNTFWSKISNTPCFLPAVTDVDDEQSANAATSGVNAAYSLPPSESAAPHAFVSSKSSSLRNRAFVSKS